LVDIQGISLPPTPVIGEGELGLDMLAQWMLGRQLPKLRNHLTFLAETELRIYAGREELESHLVEALSCGPA
jgi:hypothetical protein